MGMIPKKTKADYYLFRHLSLVRVVGLIISLTVGSWAGDLLVDDKLKIFFIVFCCAEFVILSSKSPSDPTKNFGAGLIDWISFKVSKRKLKGEEYEAQKEE